MLPSLSFLPPSFKPDKVFPQQADDRIISLGWLFAPHGPLEIFIQVEEKQIKSLQEKKKAEDWKKPS